MCQFPIISHFIMIVGCMGVKCIVGCIGVECIAGCMGVEYMIGYMSIVSGGGLTVRLVDGNRVLESRLLWLGFDRQIRGMLCLR